MVKQPSMLLNIGMLEIKTQNISHLQQWHQNKKIANLYSQEDLFPIRHSP